MTFERWCRRCADEGGLFGLLGLLLALLYVVFICAPYEFIKEHLR